MAEEINNEKTYHLIFTGKYLTADEARQMYTGYTIEEILRDIEKAAAKNHKITGYDLDKLPEPVIKKLKELGYNIYSGGIGKVEISWE